MSILEAGFNSTIRSHIWTGRPLRAAVTPYIQNWEDNRRDELHSLLHQGIVPLDHELHELKKAGNIPREVEEQSTMR